MSSWSKALKADMQKYNQDKRKYSMSTNYGFYLVWNENTETVRFRHATRKDAEMEAERLASIHKGKRFHVLHSVGSCVSRDVVWDKNEASDLPF